MKLFEFLLDQILNRPEKNISVLLLPSRNIYLNVLNKRWNKNATLCLRLGRAEIHCKYSPTDQEQANFMTGKSKWSRALALGHLTLFLKFFLFNKNRMTCVPPPSLKKWALCHQMSPLPQKKIGSAEDLAVFRSSSSSVTGPTCYFYVSLRVAAEDKNDC